MKQIRENVFQVTFTEIGKPPQRGWTKVPGGGKLMLDAADMNFIEKMSAGGYEPTFFVSRAAAMGNEFVVVARQWADEIQ